MKDLALQAQVLECLMRLDEREGPGAFVDLAALQAHQAVLHHVETPVAVAAGDDVHLLHHLHHGKLFPVELDGDAGAEPYLHVCGLIGGLLRIDRYLVDIRGRLGPGILEHAAFDGTAEHVVVDGVGRALGGGHLHSMSRGPFHLLRTRVELPIAHGRQDREGRIEHGDAVLEANLVVSLARATVRHVLGVVAMRHLHQVLADDRTRERGEQGVFVFVEGVGENGLGQEIIRVIFAHVHDVAVDGTGAQGLRADLVEVLVVLLADLAHDGHDVEVEFFLKPLDAAGGVQAAGIGQDDDVFLLHDGFLSRAFGRSRFSMAARVRR